MPGAGGPSRPRRHITAIKEQREHDLETIRLINAAIEEKNFPLLRKYAAVRGLVNNQIRSMAWPLLLGGDATAAASTNAANVTSVDDSAAAAIDKASDPALFRPGGEYEKWASASHRDSSTVAVDVERSLWAFSEGWTEQERAEKRAELRRLLNAVVNYHGENHVFYYQGLHDVASVLLLVAGSERAAFPLLARLTTCHLRDSTRSGLDSVVEVLPLLLPILDRADPALAAHVRELCPQPYFALTWVLTWFSHDAPSLAEASRMFDLFMASHPLLPLYFGAAAMCASRAALLRCGDMPELHTALVGLRPGRRTGRSGSGSAAVLSSGGNALSGSGSFSRSSSSSSAGAASATTATATAGGGAPLSLDELAQRALHVFKHVAPPDTLVPRVPGPLKLCVSPAAQLVAEAWHVPATTPSTLIAAAGTALGHASKDIAGGGGVLGLVRFVLQLQGRKRRGSGCDGGRSRHVLAPSPMAVAVVMVGLSMVAFLYQSNGGQMHNAEELIRVVMHGLG